MNYIVSKLKNLQKFEEYTESIAKKNSPIQISGLSSVGKILFMSATLEKINRPICIVTYNEIEARNIVNNLKYFIDENKIDFFLKREIASYDYVAESKDLPFERIETLKKIRKNKIKIIVTTVEAIMQKMILPNDLFNGVLKFKVGDTVNLELIKEDLVQLGYERKDLIETKADFSVRGDIIDIAISDTRGIRIELWGEQIDSIREFLISSQRSDEMKQQVEIYPAHEFILGKNTIEEVCNEILNEDEYENENIKDKEYLNILKSIKQKDVELIKSGEYISKIDKYFNHFYKNQGTFLDYLNEKYIILFDEFSKINQRQENIIIENNNLINTLIEKKRFVPEAIKNISMYNPKDIEKQIIYLDNQDFGLTKACTTKFIFNFRDVNYYKSETEILFEDLKNNIGKKEIVVLAGNAEEANKFNNILKEKNINSIYVEKLNSDLKISKSIITVTEGKLSEGFESFDLNLIVITGEELFSTSNKKKRRLSSSFKQGEKVVFADLKVGDYIVHKHHGIGEFIGVNTIKADGTIKDYIKIRYRNDDMLYIPTNDLDSIRKYIGGGEGSPKINKLGSKEWENTKQKVKNNLKQIAKELIELYAKRQKVKGYSFSKDTPWQKEFEDSFAYVETEDQLRCIEETKKDMENDKPMDRLLCGDVGYR